MPDRLAVSAERGSEQTLIAAARNNDEAAIRSIIRQHNQMLFRLARSILPSDDAAEDAVQAGYMRAFTRLDSFRGESSLRTWLGRIVLNEALGRARRERPTVTIEALETMTAAEIIPFPLSPSSDPERSMAERQMRRTRNLGAGRRHAGMDERRFCRAHRDRTKRRMGCHAAAARHSTR